MKLDMWSVGVIGYEMFNKYRMGKFYWLPYALDKVKF